MSLRNSILSLAAAVLLAASCGLILEDRTDCPCWLTLQLRDDCSSLAPDARVRLSVDGQALAQENMTRSGTQVIAREYTVPKGIVRVCVWAGAEGEPVGGTVIPFTKNEAIDTLWAYSRLVDCSEETVVDTVGLNRYFTDVTIVPDGGTWAAMNVGRIEIRTSVGGFDLESLCTVPGDWGQIRDVASAGASGIRFTVPRMSYEEEFTLVFYELEGGGLDGGELEVWDLQKMLISSNYSWSKDDLDDVIVHHSGTDAGIGLEIAPWTPGSVYDWHSE